MKVKDILCQKAVRIRTKVNMSQKYEASESQRAAGQSSTDTDDHKLAEHINPPFKITGNKYHILMCGKTLKCYEEIRNHLQGSGLEEVSAQECDFIVVFSTLVSRAGHDIEAALKELNKLSGSKPAIFVVFHHTFDPEKVVLNSSLLVNRANTLTVDVLFNEDEGLLTCMKNEEELHRIHQCLPPQDSSFLAYFGNWLPWSMCKTLPETVTPVKMSVEPSPNREQDAKLLEDLEELLKHNDQIVASELMIVLLGMSRSGKTAVGNMILGRKEMQETVVSKLKITVDSEKVGKEHITVMDTPDWFMADFSLEKIKENIERCIRMCSCGPYAVLLIIPVKQFTEEEREIVVKKMTMIEERYWEKIIIVLTTKQEKQNIAIEEFQQNIQSLVEKCENRVYTLNIEEKEKSAQVSDLLKMIEELVAGNPDMSDGYEDSMKLTTSEFNAAIKSEQERKSNYKKEQLLDSQRTVWISSSRRNLKKNVLDTLKRKLSDNCEEGFDFIECHKAL